MLTIYSCVRPFEERFNVVQRNAIESWLQLRPRPRIILFAGSQLVRDLDRIAAEYSIEVSDCERSSLGRCVMNGLINRVESISVDPFLLYCSADVMIDQSTVRALDHCRNNERLADRFCVATCRRDTSWTGRFDDRIPFVEQWAEMEDARWSAGRDDQGDYFLHTRGFWGSEIPPFNIGMASHDNWCYRHASTSGRLVRSISIAAYHQSHPQASGEMKHDRDLLFNRRLFEGLCPNWRKEPHRLSDANWTLRGDGTWVKH